MRALVDYLGGLELVGGDHDGERFEVLPWERRFIRGAFRQPGDAALSVARGNGKSALVAGIATAVVDPWGPLHRRRGEVVVAAASFEQGRIVYRDVLGYLRSMGHDIDRDRSTWRKQDGGNRAIVEHRPSEASVRCIGSEPGTAHGLRPLLVLADEPAQWEPSKSDRMVAALRTGLGKTPGARLVALGTRPAAAGHWFSRLLAGEAAYSQVHAAPSDAPPFQLRTWRRANPSLEHLPSLLAQLREEAATAKRDPDALASFRALRLNLGTSDTARSVLLDSDRWSEAEALGAPEATDGGYVLGVDLGTSAAMSAVAAYWRSGRLDAFAVFPRLPSLAERGVGDGVGRLYLKLAERGELIVAGERVSDIGGLLAEALHRWGPPGAVVCDRWREPELRQALEPAGVPWCPVVIRGQGYRDGGEDVRDFRRAVLGGHVRPVESLLLRSALSEARVATDPAGNSKLAKGSEGGRRQRARDDAAAAAILAVAAGFREWHRQADTERRLLVGSVG